MDRRHLFGVGVLWMFCVTAYCASSLLIGCGSSSTSEIGPAQSETESARMLRMFNPILVQKLAA